MALHNLITLSTSRPYKGVLKLSSARDKHAQVIVALRNKPQIYLDVTAASDKSSVHGYTQNKFGKYLSAMRDVF